jgi:hypothetical protein
MRQIVLADGSSRHRNAGLLLIVAPALLLSACATDGADGTKADGEAPDRDRALQVLERVAGAPVALDVGATGATRALTMTPRFHVAGNHPDPAVVAARFLGDNHDAFQIDAAAASSFVVTRVDVDPGSAVKHVTLQRFHDGDPVFHGAITIHMDGANRVFRALGDDRYRISPPVNQRVLTPTQAAVAAGHEMGLPDLEVSLLSADAQHVVLSSTRTLDPIDVTRQIFPVAPDDTRFAYQVTLSWLDQRRQLQYQLVLVDAESGARLASYDLVDTFTGRVFTASPGADPLTDDRMVVSFDGDAAASPAATRSSRPPMRAMRSTSPSRPSRTLRRSRRPRSPTRSTSSTIGMTGPTRLASPRAPATFRAVTSARAERRTMRCRSTLKTARARTTRTSPRHPTEARRACSCFCSP